jgi:hypothetical protein
MVKLARIVISQIQCLKVLLDCEYINENINDEIILTQQMYDEFLNEDNCWIVKLKSFMDKNLIKIEDISIFTEEYYTYKAIINGKLGIMYGRCESSAMSIAIHSNVLLLTEKHEKCIKNIGKHNLTWITISDFLKSIT